MTTTAAPTASGRQPGLGILAARLLFAVQDELYQRLEAAGHGELTRFHGAVIAHLDETGTRATELARRSGRHKQVIGRIVDELEALGYVERRAEAADRRAKLVVPTNRGRKVMRLSDEIVHDIERRVARTIGEVRFESFWKALTTVVDALTERADPAPYADHTS
ncbi:MAG: MarR family winged helix-turn-helix transcriptional regulator [Carbonactinosporaceae bacterium]